MQAVLLMPSEDSPVTESLVHHAVLLPVRTMEFCLVVWTHGFRQMNSGCHFGEFEKRLWPYCLEGLMSVHRSLALKSSALERDQSFLPCILVQYSTIVGR